MKGAEEIAQTEYRAGCVACTAGSVRSFLSPYFPYSYRAGKKPYFLWQCRINAYREHAGKRRGNSFYTEHAR